METTSSEHQIGTGGERRKPAASASPFFQSKIRPSPSALSWVELTSSKTECLAVLESLAGVPDLWLEWADRCVNRRMAQGANILNVLPFKLTVLWQGIVCLQEAKFLCDLMENALRVSLSDWLTQHDVSLVQLQKSIPYWKETISSMARSQEDPHTVGNDSILCQLGFYQTTETIARHWKQLRLDNTTMGKKTGLRLLFWSNRNCRGVGQFQKSMKLCRETRNIIAHSKSLIQPDEITRLERTISNWLKPLGISSILKIAEYRKRRPRFLEFIDPQV